jgi:hypothetical protein
MSIDRHITARARIAFATVIVMLLAGIAAPVSAQYLDPDRCFTCVDKREHFTGGVALDVLARGPWIARSFRDQAWKRVAITTVVATSWELIEMFQDRKDGKAGRPGYGFGPLDVAATVAGSVATEVLTSLAAHMVHRPHMLHRH